MMKQKIIRVEQGAPTDGCMYMEITLRAEFVGKDLPEEGDRWEARVWEFVRKEKKADSVFSLCEKTKFRKAFPSNSDAIA